MTRTQLSRLYSSKDFNWTDIAAGLFMCSAFSEAAAYYVSDKVGRWCDALYHLDIISRDTTQDPVIRKDELDSIAFTYNKVTRANAIVGNIPIASPDLSTTLRDAIDKQILDSGPLTKAFDDTLLGSLRDALLPP